MSKKTVQFEIDLTNVILSFKNHPLPSNLPQWLTDLNITSNCKIIDSKRVGSSGGKTDIIITFDNDAILKISAKMSSAAYFGNWYSHTRVIKEFGEKAFQKLTTDCTEWANNWINNQNSSLFVGVSICFGKRTGETAKRFTEVFSTADIIKIVAGTDETDKTANCLYISSETPKKLEDLLINLKPINTETITEIAKNFQIVYRPINPATEYSNRAKCVYSQFNPHQNSPSQETHVENLNQLKVLGSFKPTINNSLNHNRILKELDNKNIKVKRISKEESKTRTEARKIKAEKKKIK